VLLGVGHFSSEVLQIGDECLGVDERLSVFDALDVSLIGMTVCGTDGDNARGPRHLQLQVRIVWNDHELGVTWPPEHNVIRTPEPYHLEREGFFLEIGGGPEANRQVDLPEGMHPLVGGDPMEWRGPRPDLRPPDP
jgi:hypothetical protein